MTGSLPNTTAPFDPIPPPRGAVLPVTITLATFLAAALPSSETIALRAIFSVIPSRVPLSTTGLTVFGYLGLPSELPR